MNAAARGDLPEVLRPAPGRRVFIAALLFLLCALTLYLRFDLRYGSRPYLFYGDPATGLPNSDAVTWNIHALHLVEGRGFGDYLKQFRSRNYVPPGHPLILGFFYLFFGKDPESAGWGVAVLGALLPLLAYLWGREMWGRRIGLITAALAALHLPYIHIGYSLMSEPTTVFTTALSLWLGARLLRRPGPGRAAAAGLVFGGSALVRPSALAFLWGLALMLLFIRRIPVRRRLAALAVLAACTLIPLGAWQYRNYRVHGRAAAIYSSISARHAWNGAHPIYGPGFYSRKTWHETLWRDPAAPELAMIERLQEETGEFIRADRLKYFVSCLWRMKVLVPEFMHRAFGIGWTHGGWGRIHFMALVSLALVGLLRALPLRSRITDGTSVCTETPGAVWAGSLLIGLVAAFAGAGMYGAADRYRWPLEYALLPFAALCLDGLLRLATHPFFSRRTLASRWAAASRPLRLAQRLGLAALAAAILVYAAGLIRARRNPDTPEASAPQLSEERVRRAFERAGLLAELEAQGPRRITYEDVFAEQSQNFGALTESNMKLVAWWGRLRFPRSDNRGLKSGYVILDPRPGDFGGARLPIFRMPKIHGPAHRFRDGDMVTFIARLHYEPAPLEMPTVVFYDALPGRYDRQEAKRGSP